jgi:hypothetical protein
MVSREVLFVVAALAACGDNKPAPAKPTADTGVSPDGRFHGQGFSGPVPSGWRLIEADYLAKLGPGVVGIRAIESRQGWLRPSVFVISTGKQPYTGGTDEAQCKQSAAAAGTALQRDVKFAGIVDGPLGPTCRQELISRGQLAATGEQQLMIITVLTGSSMQVTHNCSVDPRDEATIALCGEILAGFKFQ